MRKIIKPKIQPENGATREVNKFLWFPVWLPNKDGKNEFK